MSQYPQIDESINEQSRLTRLAFLHSQVTGLRIVKCHMAHERVVRSPDTLQPKLSQLFPHSFERWGLCTPDVRAERLGCSHTMSRILLDRVIDELESDIIEQFRDELNRVTNEIHLLDHKKGQAEARKAIAEMDTRNQCEGGELSEELLRATAEIKQLEQEHDGYVERVGAFRGRIIQELEKMMMKYNQ